jgi:acetylornithine deacetylase
MGKEVIGKPYGEAEITRFVENCVRTLGLAVERQEVEPGRHNVVARLDGVIPPENGGRILLVDVHQDTVGVEGMADPFEPRVADGRVYGRGACDVKGSLAVMLSVLARLAEDPPPQMPTVILACTVNEENGFTGVKRLARSLTGGDCSLLERLPDAAIVCEPTGLDVVVAHKGVVRWRCETFGRAAHSSSPELGENAIYKMGHVVQALQQYSTALMREGETHPRLGAATMNVGTISGGAGVNTVPDHCCVEIDRRLLPGEDPAKAQAAVQEYVVSRVEEGNVPQHEKPSLFAPALSDAHNGRLADHLVNVAKRCGVTARHAAVPYATDAWAIAEAGVPTVVFGPGSIEQAHTIDEWIAVEQLHLAATIFFELCCQAPT